MPNPTRRHLLLGGAATGLVAAFAGALGMPRASAAVEESDQHYIFCYFNGGWDLLLSLDPRDPRVFRDDLAKVTRIQPGYGELPAGRDDIVHTAVDGLSFGPYAGRLADHAEKLVVLRGMSMDTLTHEVGRRRFLTGRPPSGLQARGSSLATVLAAELGFDEAIPNLSLLVESYNATFPPYASGVRVNSVSDLIRALRKSEDELSEPELRAVDALLSGVHDCDRVRRSAFHQDALTFRESSKQLVSLGLDAGFDFSANTPEMEAVRDHYGIDPSDLASAPAQAAAAVRALTSGISRTVSLETAKGLDSHGPEWSSSHGPRLERGFDLVATMLEDLESREYADTGSSWLDHTTVMVFSEFGRTPLLNSSGGRDHYLHNACVLAGGGLQGGRVIGRSSDVGMAPQKLDLVSGQPSPTGEIVKPEHVFRALLQRAGITDDVAELGVDPLGALL